MVSDITFQAFRPILVIWGLFWPLLAQTQDCLYCLKWPRCLESDIQNHLHQISARLAIILRCHKTSLRQFYVRAQKWLLVAPKWHKMAWNDLNPLKLPPETISIGFLLLLRSFWVVTWPVYDHLEFKAKIGPKWPKRAPNDRNWPECLKSDIRNHLHWISASLAVILSGHMTSLRQSCV